MKKFLFRLVSVVCILTLLMTCFAGCSDDETAGEITEGHSESAEQSLMDATSAKSKNPVILSELSEASEDYAVIGVNDSVGIADPFGMSPKADSTVSDLIMVRLLETDREGYVVKNGISGETVAYNGTEYTYNGIADVVIDGNTLVFTLDEDIYFSDGVNLTADDVIFSMYVLCDPAYDGTSTFAELPIVGLNEYRGSMQQKWKVIINDLLTESKSRSYTKEEKEQFLQAFEEAGLAFTREIVAGCVENFADDYSQFVIGISPEALLESEGHQVAFSQYIWDYSTGFGEDGLWYDTAGNSYDLIETFPTVEDYWKLILEKYGYDISDNGINYEQIGARSFEDILLSVINEKYPHLIIAAMDGGSAHNISGICKTGVYSFTVELTELTPENLNDFCIYVAPMHYYGSRELYKYSENNFGFVKGDLSDIKTKTEVPLGAGAYVFSSAKSNGDVYLCSNSLYYKGCPKTELLIITDDCENADVQFVEYAGEEAYSGSYIEAESNTYVTIGMNAAAISVGRNALSEASVSLRNAFATVFKAYRSFAVEQWENEGAESITDDTVWSEDIDEVTRHARIEAINCLRSAGYTWDTAQEKFVKAPRGARMSYEVKVFNQDAAYIVLTYAKELFAGLGITLDISVQSSIKSLENIVHAGEAEMWVIELDNFGTEDIYDLLHSEGENNVFSASTPEMDRNITWADGMFMNNVSSAIYADIMEDAVNLGIIVPVYKQVNAVVYSERIIPGSVSSDITAYWPWIRDIHLLDTK